MDLQSRFLDIQSPGRAYYGYYTVGGNDYLGSLSGAGTWVKQTASGYFEAGQCTD